MPGTRFPTIQLEGAVAQEVLGTFNIIRGLATLRKTPSFPHAWTPLTADNLRYPFSINRQNDLRDESEILNLIIIASPEVADIPEALRGQIQKILQESRTGQV